MSQFEFSCSWRRCRTLAFLLLGAAVCAAHAPAAAQVPSPVRGHVVDGTGQPLPQATVEIVHGARATSDASGAFEVVAFSAAPSLRVSCPGYQTVTRVLDLAALPGDVRVALDPSVRLTDEIVVQAVRADTATPVTKTDLDQPAIAARNYGQEMPYLIDRTPSMSNYSESGLGAGYSYFYLRGVQQTRINMTLDGAPLNDPEESAVYFANFGDFASALESIQIQRGVGTSTVGSSSYGGSINFASADLGEKPEISARVEAGSFGTEKGTVALQSGRTTLDGFAFYLRGSLQTTDGFREHSGVDQRALYFGASRQGESSFFKLFGFSAHEKTHLAFLATDKDVLEQNLRFNPMQPQETDSFGQDFLQMQYTKLFGTSTTVSAQAYYNGAQGWFALWDDPATHHELQRYAIDGYFTGGIVSVNATRGPLDLTWGAHASTFARDHFLDVARGERAGERLYSNTGHKSEANSFVKFSYALPKWLLYGDAQVRHAEFRYDGTIDLGPVSWTFFSPKLGARVALRPDLTVYGAIGRAEREPTRNDLLAGEDDATVVHDLRAVKPERVTDYELGSEWRRGAFSVALNLYAMEFRDEIALTGELSEIGLPLRRNADRSFRRGVELDAGWRPTSAWNFRLTANVSHNRITAWTQFYDVYGADGGFVGQESRVLRNVEPLLTPTVIVNPSLEWQASSWMTLALQGRYVGRSWLDNTNAQGFDTPSFFQLDLATSAELRRWISFGEPRIRLQVNNALDNKRIWPSGYSYLFLQEDGAGARSLQGVPSYYPQATRSFFVALEFRH